jgi:hypothetical protein
MLVLSFRDMTVGSRGGVTSAAVYNLKDVTPAFAWNPAPPFTLAGWSDVQLALQGKHVGFLVHGFNVGRDSGYTALGALGQELAGAGVLPTLPQPPGAFNFHAAGVDVVVPVLWPGDGYGPLYYPFLLGDVRLVGKYFSDFIRSAATQMARVSFLTHSMGARVVLETVQQTVVAAAKSGQRVPIFDTAVMTAAATSDEVLDDPNYAAAVDAIRRFVVVSSRADKVLSLAFPSGNLMEQILTFNDPGADDALGRYGPRLKAQSKALGKTEWYEIPAQIGQDHGDYLPHPDTPTPPYPNGWFDKSLRIGQLAEAVFDGGVPPWPPAKPVTPRPN